MTISVTIDYPSDKLLPIVCRAITNLSLVRNDIVNECSERTEKYSRLPWYKRIFADNPNSLGGENCLDLWTASDIAKELSDLFGLHLACNKSDVVRITGECLARLDELAGSNESD